MNFQKTLIQLSIFLVILVIGGNGENILAIAFWSSKSHKITYQPLLEALAAKGHNVTVLSPIPAKTTVPNMREILSSDFDAFMASRSKGFTNVFEMKEQTTGLLWISLHLEVLQLVVDACRFTLEQPHLRDLQEERFDLIIMPMLYNECSAAFAHTFNTTTIFTSPLSVVGHISSLFGNPTPTSIVPNAFTGFSSDRTTFLQRLENLLTEGLVRAMYNFVYVPAMENVVRQQFNDPEFPNLSDILKNSSLILSNSNFAISKPRPFLPDIVEVGGMHCQKPKPLPKDLEEFVESSGSDGFILFSMGSNAKSSDMPEHKRLVFLEAFSKLKQKVLWKWELDTPIVPNLPKNIKLSKWLPQQDLLGHPKIRAFVTHGGFGSTTEAVCHGTPLVGIPMFADQHNNMEGAENAGFALTANFVTVTADSLLRTIQRVVDDPSFKANAKRLSEMLLDQPMGALDRAVFWTEYVMRHKGATHLRSAARNLNFFQYYSLDVIGLLIVSILIVVYVVLKSFSYIGRKLLRVLELLLLVVGSTRRSKTYRKSLKKKD